MKTRAFFLTTTFLALGALGLTTPVAHADWNEIHRDRQELHRDRRELYRDRRELREAYRDHDWDRVRQERAEIHSDWNELRHDRGELRDDAGARWRDDGGGRWDHYRRDNRGYSFGGRPTYRRYGF